ncbi:MAG: hypothetical protein HPY71_14420 [Firmicutes bacterium]|nr:hypothetical protein [Bacillota bacterium]
MQDIVELQSLFDLKKVGIRPDKVISAKKIHEKHGNQLWRIKNPESSFVLKLYFDINQATEIKCYPLLNELQILTLPVHGACDNALLLEDLDCSLIWRLATAGDMYNPETGIAMAQWYLMFHAAGRQYVNRSYIPEWLKREVDCLDSKTIYGIGVKFGYSRHSAWKLAVNHIEELKQAMRSLPETFNFNDFHWTNLSLSRGNPLRALMFDYHLMGIGLAYSDCRNIISSLGSKAVAAFWDTYGPIDERERLFDDPTSILYALYVAMQRPKTPSWASECISKVENGEFERSLRAALEIV